MGQGEGWRISFDANTSWSSVLRASSLLWSLLFVILSADFGLIRRLVDRVPWEAVLKGKGVQEGWTFFKKEILKAQEQAIPMCRKTSWRGRRPAWLNRELWLELREKKESL